MEYRNLDLEVFDYHVEGDVEQFRVRVAGSPSGEQRGDEEVAVPPGLRQRLPWLERGQLGLDETISLGQDLANLLFPPEARLLLVRSQASLGEGERLRIRLRMRTHALSDLPWEYAYLLPPDAPPGRKGLDGFVALDRRLSLVRYEVMGQAPGSLDPTSDGALRFVALLASPQNTTLAELDLNEEERRIREALEGVPQVQPRFYTNATVDALLDALARETHILHFFGHGTYSEERGMGYLLLVDAQLRLAPLSAEELALHVRDSGVRLAVLSACEGARRDTVNAWSSVATALIRAGVPAVVGMQYRVTAKSAIAFSQRLYRDLAAGQPIDAAVTAGRLAILGDSRDNESDWGIPVLYLRAGEGVLFPRPAAERLGAGGAYAGRQVQREATAGPPQIEVDKRVLRRVLMERFSVDEIEALCADVQGALEEQGISLQVNLEMVGGSGKVGKVLNLIGYLDRRDYVGYLVEAMRQARPGVI
jgi:hypothetical protein